MSARISSGSAAYFALIARQMNVSSKAVSPVKITGVIPGGFPYNAFNGGAKVRPESMLNIVETVRGNVFNSNPLSKMYFLDADKIYRDYLLFINASTTEVDEELYNVNVCKGPLVFETELDHVGKTSSQLKTSFYLDGMSKPVIVSRVSSVFICNKTRVPKPPPDWWNEKYVSLIKDHNGTKSIGRLEFNGGDDSQATENHFRVFPSDCDAYRHTNWSHYIRYCHDAFGQHQIAKHGDKGFEEYYQRGARCFSIHYKNESSVRDLLTVRTSPANSDSTNSVFYFRVENESKALVCQSKIEYYPATK